MNEGIEQTWSGDVWRFPCVAESIHPRLFVALLPFFLPPALGRTQDTATPSAYAKRITTTDYPETIWFPLILHPPFILSLSHSSWASLTPFPALTVLFPRYSNWIHPAPSSLTLLISLPSSASSFELHRFLATPLKLTPLLIFAHFFQSVQFSLMNYLLSLSFVFSSKAPYAPCLSRFIVRHAEKDEMKNVGQNLCQIVQYLIYVQRWSACQVNHTWWLKTEKHAIRDTSSLIKV